MTNTIDSNLYLSSLQKDSAKRNASGILGKDDFLKILMVQLQNQDPTNPVQDREFISQMATFSTLEQMTNMNKAIESFVQLEKKNSLMKYTTFIGQEVTWKQNFFNKAGTIVETKEGSGIISSITNHDEGILFLLNDGTLIYPEEIVEIHSQTYDNQLFQASQLIGKQVTYLNSDGEQFNASVESVSFKNGKTEFHLTDGTMISAKDIVMVSQ